MKAPTTSLGYRLARPLLKLLLLILFRLLGGLRVEGQRRVPRRGGLLVTPNHISDCDPLALGAALPRPCWFMAKEELFAMRGLGPFIRFFHAFPVRRGEADRTALRMAETLLKAGEAVVIFPEGQLSATGELQPMLSGAALLALRAEVPVLPVGIEATNEVLPYGRRLPRRSSRPVVVRFGAPLSPQALVGTGDRRDRLHRAMDTLGTEIARLSGQTYPLTQD